MGFISFRAGPVAPPEKARPGLLLRLRLRRRPLNRRGWLSVVENHGNGTKAAAQSDRRRMIISQRGPTPSFMLYRRREQSRAEQSRAGEVGREETEGLLSGSECIRKKRAAVALACSVPDIIGSGVNDRANLVVGLLPWVNICRHSYARGGVHFTVLRAAPLRTEGAPGGWLWAA